ncbi:VanZ family protein [Streptococcus ruminantium]|uniref:VanZ family protein n=1 Tax=Streptococcus ruminantium TaxID=1917441 RepID=UPI0012DDB55B|nr:VanZ family protein [Streptococcus ruminantium]
MRKTKIYLFDIANLIISFLICRWIFMDFFYFYIISIFGFPASGIDFWRPLTIILVMSFILFTFLRAIYTKRISPTAAKMIYILYFVTLLYALLFKNIGVRGFNFNIITFLLDAFTIDSTVPLLNVLIFIPLGTLFSLDYKKILLFISVISAVEVAQYLFSLGFFDVGDIFTNTIGFVIGTFIRDTKIGKKVISMIRLEKTN